MKKIFVALCSICIIALSCGLTACGSDWAKVVGLYAAVGNDKDYTFESGNNNPFSDNETIANNDYILQVGQNYLLGVAYIQRNGSRRHGLNTDNITLKYDSEVLEITPPEEKEGAEVYYNLTCKKSVQYTAVIVEVGGYSYTVIISAE